MNKWKQETYSVEESEIDAGRPSPGVFSRSPSLWRRGYKTCCNPRTCPSSSCVHLCCRILEAQDGRLMWSPPCHDLPVPVHFQSSGGLPSQPSPKTEFRCRQWVMWFSSQAWYHCRRLHCSALQHRSAQNFSLHPNQAPHSWSSPHLIPAYSKLGWHKNIYTGCGKKSNPQNYLLFCQ